jgi:hypothetical protein
MNLHGLIGGPPPRPSGSEGKPPAQNAAGRSHSFGEVVSATMPQPMNQGDEGGAGMGNALPPDSNPRHFPAKIVQAANAPRPDLDQGERFGTQTPSAAQEIANLVLDSAPPSAQPIHLPVAPGGSISDRGDSILVRELQTAITDSPYVGTPAQPAAQPQTTVVDSTGPAAAAKPAYPPESPANTAGGGDFGANPSLRGAPSAPVRPGQGSPGKIPDAANPLPLDASEAAVIYPDNTAIRTAPANTTAPAPPDAAGDVPDQNPATAHALEPNSKPPNMAGMVQPGAGDPVSARGMNLPELEARSGERGARTAPDAAPAQKIPLPADQVAEPGARPAPGLPELPAVAARGRGSMVHEAIMQARGEFQPIGLAASTAATEQSPTGSPQSLASALQANAGGAEIARAVAPQIAAAIGSGPASGRIELRLDPPELGNVEISLEITNQSLRATVMADRPATNELLRRHGDVLLTQLQQAGFTGIDLQFGGNRARNQGGAQPGDMPQPVFTGTPDTLSNSENAEVPAGRAVRRTADGLDLRF